MTEIEQVMARIATLTDAEITTLNDTPLPLENIYAADATVGQEASNLMSQAPEDTDAGVYAIARVAILGILANDDTLKRTWTDVVGPLRWPKAPRLLPILGSKASLSLLKLLSSLSLTRPMSQPRQNPKTLGAPAEVVAESVVEPVADEVGTPELVDAPLDISEGKSTYKFLQDKRVETPLE